MGRRHSYTLSGVANGLGLAQTAGRDGAARSKYPSPPSEVVLDCRSLEQRQQQYGSDEPVLLKVLTEDGYAPRDRMVGWSCVLLAAGFFLIGGGGAMLALSLTIESDVDTLTGHYNVHTTLLGGSLLGLGAGCVLLAIIKGCWHGHL